MKRAFAILIISLFTIFAQAQDLKTFKIYHPEEDAAAGIAKAVALAAKEKKHVFVQVGGNWCIWCARFYNISTKDPSIDSLLKSSFIVYHLNYSKENKNLPVLEKYKFPQRFGYPVFLILDGDGALLHTQNSAYLEEGKGYSKEKIIDFLQAWSPEALTPEKYKNN